MNIVNFNKLFERPFLTYLSKGPNVSRDTVKAWQHVAAAPLFEHSIKMERAVQLADDGGDVRPPLPFNALRLHITSQYEVGPAVRTNYVVLCDDAGEWTIFSLPLIERVTDDVPISVVRAYTDTDNTESVEYALYSHRRDEWVDPSETGLQFYQTTAQGPRLIRSNNDRDQLLAATRQILASVRAFAVDAMAPTNHVVSVAPNQPQRSVTWLKARTHYTIITHDHPANRPAVQHGQRVWHDQQVEITRMAHQRRAHWRTYTHARYRFMKGQRRFIKSMWVGPKEWQDEGGKQVYRILELADGAAVAAAQMSLPTAPNGV